MAFSTQLSANRGAARSTSLRSGVTGWRRRTGALLLALLVGAVLASTAQADPPPVLLGTADSFAILLWQQDHEFGPFGDQRQPGPASGHFGHRIPARTVNGAQHINDAVAQQAKADLAIAYKDAAGRPNTATLPPDVGGRRLTAGVYRTGSVASLGLTGNLTLDAQGDPRAGVHLPDRVDADDGKRQQCPPHQRRPGVQRVLAGGQFRDSRIDN
ncbi:MAG: ice-binding family protein [Actinomycetota bacterium]|nr:ice-binding family protein [Actinomycetota bacterium]